MSHNVSNRRLLKGHSGLISIFLVIILFSLWIQPVSAADRPLNQLRPPENVAGSSLDPEELERFFDNLIEKQMQELHIPGVTVSVVADGQLALAKGYGYADIDQKIPVDAQNTLFRIGSTSKLFTWTAIMQLVEKGKLDLNADVNTYLQDFKIPATFPEPITLLNLLTHTAGFEERYTGMLAEDTKSMLSLREYLIKCMPDRVRPPWQMTAYSNYGAALAGFIVESVSGLPFEEYIEKEILHPLGMADSTFRQPLPPMLESKLAKSYSYLGAYSVLPFLYINAAPMGSMSTTAIDMAAFMQAHLGQLPASGAAVLEAETLELMHTHLFSNDERLNGFALGFFDGVFKGQRYIMHAGGFPGWHSLLMLIPGLKVGIFIAYNSAGGQAAVAQSQQAFLDFTIPGARQESIPLPAADRTPLSILTGEYRPTRSVFNHIDRLAHFTGLGFAKLSPLPSGNLLLTLRTETGNQTSEYIEIEPLVFKSTAGTDQLIFHSENNGKIDRMFMNSKAHFAFERIRWYESIKLHQIILIGSLLICLSYIVAGLFRFVINLFRKNKRGINIFSLTAQIWACSLSVIFLFLFGCFAIYLSQDIMNPVPRYLQPCNLVFTLACILALVTLPFTILAWRRKLWGLSGRIHYTLVCMGMMGIIWLGFFWRLFIQPI